MKRMRGFIDIEQIAGAVRPHCTVYTDIGIAIGTNGKREGVSHMEEKTMFQNFDRGIRNPNSSLMLTTAARTTR